MPSQFEQDIAEDYVCNRNINRPNINVVKVLKNTVITLFFISFISCILFTFFDRFDMFTYLPQKYQQLQVENSVLFFFFFSLLILAIGVILLLRRILIGIVKLYQHYASEDVRRRCLFKPTCSEYTILVLKKYGILIGLYKAYIRLFRKCRGNIYRIDFPE